VTWQAREEVAALFRAAEEAVSRRNENAIRFEIGDKVWVRHLDKSRMVHEKLDPFWHGPYKVLQRKSATNYVIEQVSPVSDGRRISGTVHVSNMKKFVPPSPLLQRRKRL
jgi:hypothetical protein